MNVLKIMEDVSISVTILFLDSVVTVEMDIPLGQMEALVSVCLSFSLPMDCLILSLCITDNDECASSPCHPNASCTNVPGGFECTCNSNFRGNGFNCVFLCKDGYHLRDRNSLDCCEF